MCSSCEAEKAQVKKWDERFMAQARSIAAWSKDRSTKVGCLLVNADRSTLPSGYNGFPRKVNDNIPERHERPMKYRFTVHAEANAIANCARHGICTQGATAYIPWFPCAPCAGLLIQAGISQVVGYKPDLEHPVFGADFKAALEMFEEAGVKVRYLEGDQIKA